MYKLIRYVVILFAIIMAMPVWAESGAYANDKKILLLLNKTTGFSVKKNNQQWLQFDDSNFVTHYHFKSVAYANGLFVMIGDNNKILSFDGSEITSGQGPDLNGNGDLNAIKYIGNQWLAVGSYKTGGTGGIWSSLDGKNWTNRVNWSGWVNLNAIAYDGKSRVVAVGNREQYVYSEDNARTLHTGSIGFGKLADFHDVTYAKGLFVAVGGWSTIYYSPDGKEWTPAIINGFDENVSLNKVVYSPEMDEFIVVGDKSGDGSLTALASQNGKTWTRICKKACGLFSVSLTTLATNKQGVFAGGRIDREHSNKMPTLFRMDLKEKNKKDLSEQNFYVGYEEGASYISDEIDSLVHHDDLIYAVSHEVTCHKNNNQSEHITVFSYTGLPSPDFNESWEIKDTVQWWRRGRCGGSHA